MTETRSRSTSDLSPDSQPSSLQNAEAQVLFLHGLNTYGDDLLHIGPRTFGRMDRELKREISRFGITLHSVDGIGSGSPETQAELVLSWMHNKLESGELSRNRPLALLGNSLGGLVARVVAHRLPNSNLGNWPISLVVTWGTPHRGTVAAGFSEDLRLRYPKLSRAARQVAAKIQYDLDERDQTFRHYTPQALDLFNLKYPPLTKGLNSVREVSLLCRVPIQEVAPCFWPLYPRLHGRSYVSMLKGVLSQNETHAPSDGFISVGSQKWGEVRGDFRLDHFVQMGFIELLPQKSQREFARSQFRDLVRTIVELIGESTSRN